MNVNLLNALNGMAAVATGVVGGGPVDMNVFDVLQDMAVMAGKIPSIAPNGSSYDTAATSTTAYVNPNLTPINAQALDVLNVTAAKQTGANALTPTFLGG
jgi:hypothetical protein